MRPKDRKRCPGTWRHRPEVEVVLADRIPAEARACALGQFPGWALTTWKHCQRCSTWWAELKDTTHVPRGMVARRRVVVGMDSAGWAPEDFKPIIRRI